MLSSFFDGNILFRSHLFWMSMAQLISNRSDLFNKGSSSLIFAFEEGKNCFDVSTFQTLFFSI